MAGTSVGFVGTVGGVGTTRSILEIGGVLARNGLDVLVIDLDFATQGLARHVEGPVGVDSTALLADPDHDLADAIQAWPLEGAGTFEVIPAHAPFVTIAEAKSATAGARVSDRLDEATDRADWVLVDVPPVVSNQSIGAVTATDRVVAVIPPGDRGVDALQRERGRLADVGTAFDDVLAVGKGEKPPDATARIPDRPDAHPTHRPATLEAADSFTRGVTQATAVLLPATVETPEPVRPLDQLKQAGNRLLH